MGFRVETCHGAGKYSILDCTRKSSLTLHQPALGASLKVAKDLKLFDRWHERGDGEMTREQLAEMVSCDLDLFCQYTCMQ